LSFGAKKRAILVASKGYPAKIVVKMEERDTHYQRVASAILQSAGKKTKTGEKETVRGQECGVTV